MPNVTIDHQLLGIGEVLRARALRVPTYQRPYSWKTAHLTDYWTDLREGINTQPDYFLGSIVLTPEGGGPRLTVIDGQQRLATTAIFMSCARDILRERGETQWADHIQREYLATYDPSTKAEEPRLRLSDQDDTHFAALVVVGGAPQPTLESHRLLTAARSYLLEELRKDIDQFGAKWDDRLRKWVDFLDQAVAVIRVQVPTESDAFLIFETLNARGENLTPVDLLKNYLFGRAGKQLDTARRAWGRAVGLLDTTTDSDLVIDFVRHYWCSRNGPVREKDLYRQMKATVHSEHEAVALAEELEAASRLYSAILNSDHEFWLDLGTTGKTHVETLLRLGIVQNRPLLLAAMEKFTPAEIRLLLRSLVAWSVRGLIVGGIGAGTTERYYSEVAVKVRNGILVTAEAVRTALAGTPVIPTDAAFAPIFGSTEVRVPRLARYYLRAIERHLAGEAEPEMVPNADEDQINLEHVLPKSPVATDWPEFDPNDFTEWSARLGNLALLQKTPNKKIGNLPFVQKVPVYAASTYKTTANIAKAAKWSPAEVDSRQRALAKEALKVWPA